MLNFIVDILKQPSILVGLIALFGLILQKKNFSDTLKGTLKTILGFVILQGGAGILVGSLEPFGKMFEVGFHVQGIVPNNEAIVALALDKYGTPTALIMAFGMVANILFARYSRLKYIYLSGHCTFYMSCMISIILVVAGFSGVLLIAIGSIILGFTMAAFPAIAQPFMKKITGTDDVALGHTGSIGYALSGWIGTKVGKGSKSTEELNMPKNLSFLRDSSMSIALTMSVLYLIVAFASGQQYIETNLSGGQNFLIFSLLKGITFSAGVVVILQGVRMLLAEIVPAFAGISEKVAPNAKPALDCPIIFPYAPNAVLIGFISSFIGGIVGLLVLGKLGLVLILPGVVPHFFCGASAGVFGNATGGRRGAIIGSFVHGLFITAVPVILLPMLGSLGFANTTFSDSDYGVVGVVMGAAAGNKGLMLGLVIVLIVISLLFPRKKKSISQEA